MILVVGGKFQGQLDFVLKTWDCTMEDVIDCETCDLENLANAKIILDYHEIVKRLLKNSKDVKAFTEKLIRENKDAIVIMDEVGCGVVPATSFEREYRETVGRMSCDLASVSEKVYRVFCGVGTLIKG